MDKQKSTLIDVLVRLGVLQVDIFTAKRNGGSALVAETATNVPEVTIEEIDDTMNDLKKWVDPAETKVFQPNDLKVCSSSKAIPGI